MVQPVAREGTWHSTADRFDAIATAYPRRVAICTAAEQLSYAAAASLAHGVAAQIVDAGVPPGARVAVLGDQQPSAFCALLGVLRSGAIAVPLTPTYPEARLRAILGECTPRAILTDARHEAQARALAGDDAIVVRTDDPGEALLRHWPATISTSIALILYTSGSTGRPKGVVQTHRNLLQRVERWNGNFTVPSNDRFALVSSMSVSHGMTVLLNALLRGATLCPFDVARDGVAALVDWLVNERISFMSLTVTLFRSLANNLDSSGRRLPDLRLLRLAGETVTASDVALYRRLFGDHAGLEVSYSATEAGPISAYSINPDDAFSDGIVPMGRPHDGLALTVADSHGVEVPDGEPGEILVRGLDLSPGYWNDPERTESRFSTVPSTGQREYRTGDLGRIKDGMLQYLGRLENRVKIRGFRVELGDVESALAECRDVLHAAVAVHPGPDGEDRIVGYIQPKPVARPTVDTLRADLAIRLPEHAIPAVFVILESFPFTESGKPDRRALLAPRPQRPVLSSAWTLPRTPLEGVIANIWREVLGLEQVGVDDSFLSLGGDSLKAQRVAAELSKAVGADLPLGELMGADTIAQIAEVVKCLCDPAQQECRR